MLAAIGQKSPPLIRARFAAQKGGFARPRGLEIAPTVLAECLATGSEKGEGTRPAESSENKAGAHSSLTDHSAAFFSKGPQ